MAIWIIFFFKTKNIYHKAFKFIILFIIIIGLFLTFSRSGIIALFLSFLIYFFISLKKWLNKPNLNGLFIGFVLIFTILFLVLVINFYFPVFFDFFNVKLFSLLQSNNSVNFDLEDSESSEGYRLFVMKKVLNFLINNPITGSGYLGVWILFDDKSGSAHGQFIDVIFRTGIFGFIIYLYILFLILRKLYYLESGLFWGTLAVLIYGFFHETFKTSHGAFIFAFLVGYTANYRNKNNELYK
jgi:O-antigen ligase